jgi:hypothetical protein
MKVAPMGERRRMGDAGEPMGESAAIPAQHGNQALPDDRTTAHGWPRILLFLLAAGALIFSWRGVVASTVAFGDGDVSEAGLTLVSDLCWIAGAVGIIHNGRRMRRLAWATWVINAVMPFVALVVGNVALDRVSPWFDAGATYFYLPVLGAVAAIAWLAWSSPSQIATRNGG